MRAVWWRAWQSSRKAAGWSTSFPSTAPVVSRCCTCAPCSATISCCRLCSPGSTRVLVYFHARILDVSLHGFHIHCTCTYSYIRDIYVDHGCVSCMVMSFVRCFRFRLKKPSLVLDYELDALSLDSECSTPLVCYFNFCLLDI